jgi:hypothetical protein
MIIDCVGWSEAKFANFDNLNRHWFVRPQHQQQQQQEEEDELERKTEVEADPSLCVKRALERNQEMIEERKMKNKLSAGTSVSSTFV